MIEEHLRNLVISGFGVKLTKSGDLIEVVDKEGSKRLVSPRDLEQVIITGEVSITSGLVRLLLEKGVDLVFIGRHPSLFARVVRSDHNFITELWRAQIMLSDERRLEIGREILQSAIYNKMRMLKSLEKNRRGLSFRDEIERLKEVEFGMGRAADSFELMGYEGEGSHIYFSAIGRVIPGELNFTGRKKHPPPDPVNALLSYGYTVLRSRVEYGLMLAGLNPFEGIIHASYRNRPALSFDLTEEFRQVIVDRVVLTDLVRGWVRLKDFVVDGESGGCLMQEEFKRGFLERLYRRFEEEYTVEGEKMQFIDIIFRQARKLAEAIMGREKYRGFRYR
ncbi:MAG TPA: CRISPR-associated endonuclease Cas1 [Candidatus Syntrophoarchaeum butanivorans]|uniref:CRISPR-associated endonuclease Cas1 n=1 Tax=Candidatus Syntropharchaeum butanivorans TaxID=1839936 RepID=A0A1F2P3N4_9EURY|nr:MAG: CRISPR-associated protein Cas1 [Candidatus Syntrophoarchaeum butanivorans]HEC56486.1 CRISPR-associated endonuclease Cas1 [Candidatus Syntrophoarchaeum butanivorans]